MMKDALHRIASIFFEDVVDLRFVAALGGLLRGQPALRFFSGKSEPKSEINQENFSPKYRTP